MDPIIIIGSGIAAYTFAREFRKLDAESPLMLISADEGSSYPKPVLSNALAKGKQADQIALFDADTMAKKLNAEILVFTRVVKIDAHSHSLEVADGRLIPYKKLIMAVGAAPIRIPFDGDASDDILSVNDLSDYTIFRQQLTSAKHVAIIGPGLIGCEFANDLLHNDSQMKVSIIGPNSRPMDNLLPHSIADELAENMTKLGVDWHLSTTTKAVNKSGNAFSLELESGVTINADIVLLAIGLRPRTELAKAAGLAINTGIITDDKMQTSEQDIYALGDCAEVSGHNLLYIAPITAAAKALAKTLSGTQTAVKYPAMPVAIKTPCYPLVVSSPAENAQGQWHYEVAESGFGIKALFNDSQQGLLGFVLSGDAIIEKRSLAAQLPDII